MIRESLEEVEGRIRDACRRAGRRREDVTLIAVSKTKPASDIREAMSLGLRDFGENKVQEMTGKWGEIPDDDVRWHMIGHLQRNKVRQAVEKVALIHSVDSLRLAEQISLEAGKAGRDIPILLEVNIAGEEQKFGVAPEEALPLVRSVALLPHVKVMGLMTVAPYAEDPESSRPYFRELRKLNIDIKNKNIDNVCMDVLSMGMTGDYEVAIEEGATMVRIGTGIFGRRYYDERN